ncbi:MAG: ankyrin repeat domain-containing protein [Coxiellaceae bacterium]|nr:ankyrin repeat domain-containing protein [Coxiellaceae bacterium]
MRGHVPRNELSEGVLESKSEAGVEAELTTDQQWACIQEMLGEWSERSEWSPQFNGKYERIRQQYNEEGKSVDKVVVDSLYWVMRALHVIAMNPIESGAWDLDFYPQSALKVANEICFGFLRFGERPFTGGMVIAVTTAEEKLLQLSEGEFSGLKRRLTSHSRARLIDLVEKYNTYHASYDVVGSFFSLYVKTNNDLRNYSSMGVGDFFRQMDLKESLNRKAQDLYLLLNNTEFQNKLKLTDEEVLAWGCVESGEYSALSSEQVNRLFFTAIVCDPRDWSELFVRALRAVVDGVNASDAKKAQHEEAVLDQVSQLLRYYDSLQDESGERHTFDFGRLLFPMMHLPHTVHDALTFHDRFFISFDELLKLHPNPDEYNFDAIRRNKYAAEKAFRHGDVEWLRRFLQAGYHPRFLNELLTSFSSSFDRGGVVACKVLTLLLSQKHIDVNYIQSGDFQTALHRFASFGWDAAVEVMLGHDEVEINLRDAKGNTALHLAAERGYAKVVSLLMKRPDIAANLRDENGWTPLQHAVDRGYFEVVRMILSNARVPIDVAAHTVPAAYPEPKVLSPLALAEKGKNKEIIACLREYHAKHNAVISSFGLIPSVAADDSLVGVLESKAEAEAEAEPELTTDQQWDYIQQVSKEWPSSSVWHHISHSKLKRIQTQYREEKVDSVEVDSLYWVMKALQVISMNPIESGAWNLDFYPQSAFDVANEICFGFFKYGGLPCFGGMATFVTKAQSKLMELSKEQRSGLKHRLTSHSRACLVDLVGKYNTYHASYDVVGSFFSLYAKTDSDLRAFSFTLDDTPYSEQEVLCNNLCRKAQDLYLLLNNTEFQNKLKLTDEEVSAWARAELGEYSALSSEQVNRLFFTAIVCDPRDWSELFVSALRAVVDCVNASDAKKAQHEEAVLDQVSQLLRYYDSLQDESMEAVTFDFGRLLFPMMHFSHTVDEVLKLHDRLRISLDVLLKLNPHPEKYKFESLRFKRLAAKKALLHADVEWLRLIVQTGLSASDLNGLLSEFSGMDSGKKSARFAFVRFFLSQEAIDVNYIQDTDCMTVLHQFADFGCATEAEVMLGDRRTNVNARDEHGMTALHHAVESDSADVVSLLMARADIDANMRDEEGWTPLQYAVKRGNFGVVRKILSCAREPINVTERTEPAPYHEPRVASPLALAKKSKNKKIVECLRKYHAKHYGSTCLPGLFSPVAGGVVEASTDKSCCASRCTVS